MDEAEKLKIEELENQNKEYKEKIGKIKRMIQVEPDNFDKIADLERLVDQIKQAIKYNEEEVLKIQS